MEPFHYTGGELYCEQLPMRAIAAAHGTPLYVYSAAALREGYRALARAFAPLSPLVCYAVKANGNLAVLRLLVELGAGFDVVSGGELVRAQAAGAPAERIVFAGAGKREDEIRAALAAGILCFNVESLPELDRIDRLAREAGRRARVCLRLNPEVDPRTHAHIATGSKGTKFGLELETARAALATIGERTGVELYGLHAHIGSQIVDPEPYRLAVERLAALAEQQRAAGRPLRALNLGGGFGIAYRGGRACDLEAVARAIVPLLAPLGVRVLLEPGRWIAGPAGVLLTRVEYVKHSGGKRFLICDSGMHHLLRPALYGAEHPVWPVCAGGPEGSPQAPALAGPADVVGPICETADYLARERPLPEIEAGELLAVFAAGAYGMVMASNYNAQPLPAEVLVDGARARLVRRRQRYDELLAPEQDLP
ncbi:MAG: diaminopimelate decarboxylase [Planctomycetota bacterium]|nr:MAG: diaminopimelate decarboxylase [Planctomycetota bacterium]